MNVNQSRMMPHPFPEQETEIFLSQLHQASLNYPSITNIERTYHSHCRRVIPDRTAGEITDILIDSLNQQQPLSAIRIGDGEGNLLTYKQYPGTPELDRYCADTIIALQEDKFNTTDASLVRLQQWLYDAVMGADIIGVRGVDWRSRLAEASRESPQERREKFDSDTRGNHGLMRSEDYMLRLATHNLLNDKVITSAHLYFGVLRNIRRLLAAAPRIVVISIRPQLPAILAELAPHASLFMIPVGSDASPQGECQAQAQPRESPDFLEETMQRISQLGAVMQGALCLIGAGPWSELYCGAAKRWGAVAVDLGSGLDLLCGYQTRPVHRNVHKFLPDWPAIP